MEENNDKSSSTEYIRSRNMGNTIDNKHRHTKKEDPMSPDYANPPIESNQPASEADSASTESSHHSPLPPAD